MPNPDNIVKHQFKKNDPRINRKGRAPVLPELKEAIANVLNKKKGSLTGLDEILAMLFNKAKKGDIRAIQELLDRAYGKSKVIVDNEVNFKPILGITFDK
jgi:hypothetical protein